VPVDRWEYLNTQLKKLDQLDLVVKRLDALDAKFTAVETALEYQEREIADLKTDGREVRSLIENVRIQCRLESEKNEQYSRRDSIRISGVPETVDEDVCKIVISLSKELGVVLSSDDISACHRVFAKNKGKRQIIVKMISRRKKEELLQQAKKLAKTKAALKGVYFNEDLTELRNNMCFLARKRKDTVKRVVTNNGNITCFLHEKKADGKNKVVRLNTPDDFAQIGANVAEVKRELGLCYE
jgi:hypothetical protein